MLLKFTDSCTLSILKKQIVTLAMMFLLLDCVLTVSEIRIRAGSLDSYTDTSGNLWLGDRYFNVGTMDKTSGVTFANTQEQDLYRFERWNDVSTQLAYTIPGLDAGVYTVNLHFSEFFETAFKVGVRVTDIYLQDKLVLSGYDIYKEVGAYAASVKTFEATVTSSGTLKIGLERIARNPKITAIHVVLKSTAYPPPSICPCSLPGSLAINSINPVSTLPLESVQITGRNFASGCIAYFGTIAAVQTIVQSSTSIQAVVPAGYTGLTSVTVKKGSTTSNGVDFTIARPSDHTAHSVPGEDYSITDAEDLGYVTVTLNGQGSHTHLLPPATLVSYEWKLGDTILGTSVVISARIPVGVNPIRLKVVDSAGNADIAIITITVLPPVVNGVETYYYQYSSSLTKIPDIDSKKPDYGLIESNGINYQTNFPATAYTSNFALEFKGFITTPTSGTYSFSLESDDGSKLIINGVTVINHDGTHSMKTLSGTTSLSKGQHSFRVIYFQAAGGKGVKLYWKPPGSSNEIIPASALSFDQQFVKPVIHSIYPPSGGLAGGYRITITGFGFFYSSSKTTVTIGGKACTDVQVKDSSTIGCVVPASSAISASVVVTTPATTSNSMQFLYSDTASVVSFQYSGLVSVTSPTVVKFGPDEKLYVGSVEGLLTRFTLDESMAVTDTVTSDVFDGKSILGINFNPKDFANTGNVYIYVTHSILYHDTTTDAVGGVSIVSGSRMNVVQDLITGLPVSERDHGINGLEFNQNLDLLVCIGSNTNGGLPGPLTPSGTQTEKQLSASIIIAKISKGSSFRGNVRYTNNDSENGVQNDGLDVSVYASGIKNSYDLVLHSNGLLYATDNGPTGIYGKMSTSCTTEKDGETTVDELMIVTQGSYYGHPNRARAKAMNDPRQCVFRSATTPSIPGEYTQGIGRFTSSIDGLFEYTANTFGGQMRGHLIIGHYQGGLYDVTLSSDGQSIVKSSLLAELNSAYGGLSTEMGFDGSIISTNYGPNMLNILKPQEPVPWNLPYIVSIFPSRGLMAGGNVVSVRGYGFSSDTTVTIDGKLCSNLSVVSNKKVRCTVPSTSVKGLRATVVVTSGGKQYTLPKAYWYTEV